MKFFRENQMGFEIRDLRFVFPASILNHQLTIAEPFFPPWNHSTINYELLMYTRLCHPPKIEYRIELLFR